MAYEVQVTVELCWVSLTAISLLWAEELALPNLFSTSPQHNKDHSSPFSHLLRLPVSVCVFGNYHQPRGDELLAVTLSQGLHTISLPHLGPMLTHPLTLPCPSATIDT